jgi:hypothetical protein
MSSDTEKPALVLNGGCQCGAVRYIARAMSNDAYYCHCRMCQRAFGNVRATFFNVRKSAVAFQGGPPDYFMSSAIARRGFCHRCGTPISFEYHDSEMMDLGVGSLDEPALLKPVMHVGIESRIASFHVDDGLPHKRIDEFDHIIKKWRAAYGDDVMPGPRQSMRPGR